jgi:1-acyl-sn-glycerol-3-phosphate acyltransferase
VRQLPLGDQLPYHFYPPTLWRPLIWGGGFYLGRTLRRSHRVEEIDFEGLERVAPLLGKGDGVLLTPNHPDHADCFLMFELSRRLRTPFYYMAAYQIFEGKNRWFLPRIGVFPVDREGSDLTAFKTGVNVLAGGKNPLVIFPEGEIYRLAERLTPIREGAAAVAAAAAKKLGESGKTVWVVPVAIKYRFLDRHDPLPSLHELMDCLEERFTWWPQKDRALVERIYHYAEGLLGLKEHEYLGASQTGPLKERLANLADRILERIEKKRAGKARQDTVPVRVKEMRRACLDALADPGTTPEDADALRRDLHDLFVAVQIFSYPGDYVRAQPTLERVAETLAKFEEDFLGVEMSPPRGPRRAVLRLGEPVDVRPRLAAAGKPRLATAALSADLEARMQALLDSIPPGRPLGEDLATEPTEGTERRQAEAKRDAVSPAAP